MNSRTSLNAVARWDAGETGCSQLIVGLKRRLSQLEPGEVLEVVARDLGAPIDLFVWCRMTGHRLLSEAHPVYLIQRKSH
jgi:TusA-related sulfurtransferase